MQVRRHVYTLARIGEGIVKNHANLGFEEKLFKAADKLRKNMDASEYKHVVLGLIFLKFVSDAFQQRKDDLEKELRDLEARTLTELINLFSSIDFMAGRHSESESEQDVVGRVYEYCLKSFATAEGKRGRQFYTPPVVVRILVEMLEPYEGRVFDPCCGSGGMFVQSRRFIREHQREQRGLFNSKGISVYGQESNETTWRLCKMNLAVHGIEGDIAWNPEGSFLRDAHPDLRADFVIANLPFNDSDWGGQLLRDDLRWKYGVPPAGNANYAWIQHFLYHLGQEGYVGFVMANGSLSSQQSGEGDIRKRMVEEDLVDCIVALPGQLFYSTGIPVCLWFLAKNKAAKGFRNRRGETLFINATKLGYLEDRTHRMLDDPEIAKITEAYHCWRGTLTGDYTDVAGFCRSVATVEIAKSYFVLTPGRYCGAEEAEVGGEPFAEKMTRLTAALEVQFAESARLEAAIRQNLRRLRYGD